MISNSTKYEAYISRVGENDLITQSYISQQPYLGSLFKSQNASTWEPSQWEDLKFTLYRADFIENGSVEFYSPELTQGNGQIAKLCQGSKLFAITVCKKHSVRNTLLKLGRRWIWWIEPTEIHWTTQSGTLCQYVGFKKIFGVF